ncbi:dihydrofolate reductase family protein [Brevundimonas sp. FT23028]|uniref:dihydrofolate reductase family protein n=1 Tax=Brevundimonas sp. FT23028 TaxID=3393748 RepID=UPI003B5863AB
MRKIRLASFVSIDGVMQGPGGPQEDTTGGFAFGGWVWPHFDEASGGLMSQAMGQDYDLLLGRRTYEIFAAYWPTMDNEIGRTFNAVRKYVAAGPDTPMTWAHSHRLEGDLIEAVRVLKATAGRDLLIQGSSELVQALLGVGLIDELTTLTFPIMLGRGKRLFDSAASPRSWVLEQSVPSSTGVVVNRYRLAGEVETGSFAEQEPGPAELERRARWAQEDRA